MFHRQMQAILSGKTKAVIGRRWFQQRSWSPVPLFVLLVIFEPDFTWGPSNYWGLALVLTLIVLAESVRVWAVGYAGSITRTRDDLVPVLVTAGPYRYVRNPLYIANIILYTCAGILFGFWSVSVVIFFYSIIQYFFIVSYEETLLTQTFGDPYRRFLEQVPRWFPRIKPTIAASDHQFDLARGLKSERSTFYVVGFLFLLWTVKLAFR